MPHQARSHEREAIAKTATIVNVKVLCAGSDTTVIAHAIDEISEEHQKYKKNDKAFRGSIINISFGGYGWQYSLGQAIGWARWQGVSFVSAAGNDNRATEYDWPCYWSSIMCVANIREDYAKAKRSNYGREIDYLAPGMNIKSLGPRSDRATAIMSGCSMSALHVAGISAIFVGWKGLTNGGADSYVYSNSLSAGQHDNPVAALEQPVTLYLLQKGRGGGFDVQEGKVGPPMPASVLAGLGISALGGPTGPTPGPKPTQAPAPPAKDSLKCHGISGGYWVMSYDKAVENAKTFCGQRSKEVLHNKDTVNELMLSVKNVKDASNTPTDAQTASIAS